MGDGWSVGLYKIRPLATLCRDVCLHSVVAAERSLNLFFFVS